MLTEIESSVLEAARQRRNQLKKMGLLSSPEALKAAINASTIRQSLIREGKWFTEDEIWTVLVTLQQKGYMELDVAALDLTVFEHVGVSRLMS